MELQVGVVENIELPGFVSFDPSLPSQDQPDFCHFCHLKHVVQAADRLYLQRLFS